MRTHLALTLALGLAAAMLAGCGKNNVTPPGGSASNDQAAAAAAVAREPGVVDDGLSDSPDQTSLNAPAGAAALINPLTYWRTITHVDRTFEFAFSDTDSTGKPTTAIVTIRKTLTGRFNILAGVPGTDGTPIDSTVKIVHKPLEDHWVRRILLKRVRVVDSDEDDPDAIWHVAATSGVKVTSRDATVHIESLRIQAGAMDTTITDPLAFFRIRRVLQFMPDEMVTLTVTTDDTSNVVVLMHHDRRFRFHNNGDKTFTGVWRSGLFIAGFHHFGVNALSNGTLFDDTAPYDSQAWILPYVIEPDALADFLP